MGPTTVSAPRRERLLAAAGAVAAEIRSRARTARGGSVVWLSAPPAEDGGSPAVLRPHLYEGTLGIALFLAALDHLRGEETHRPLIRAALSPLVARLSALATSPPEARPALSVGGLSGIGSFVYGLTRVAVWCGDDALLDGARNAAALLDAARLGEDRALDVVDGCAGAALALLALDRVDAEPCGGGETPLERALRCGDRLLRVRAVLPGGSARGWPGTSTPPLGGFAHGSSGIAYALFRLAARAGRDDLREAALEGLAHEGALFDEGSGGWIDPRTGRPLEQNAWCHGAPGIALARAAILAADPGAPLWEELARAVALTLALPPAGVDHLCCGNAGRIDILLQTAMITGEPALLQGARLRTAALLDREGKEGYRVDGSSDGFPNLTLFRGTAGIGYALLRIAANGGLPSPLLLD